MVEIILYFQSSSSWPELRDLLKSSVTGYAITSLTSYMTLGCRRFGPGDLLGFIFFQLFQDHVQWHHNFLANSTLCISIVDTMSRLYQYHPSCLAVTFYWHCQARRWIVYSSIDSVDNNLPHVSTIRLNGNYKSCMIVTLVSILIITTFATRLT